MNRTRAAGIACIVALTAIGCARAPRGPYFGPAPGSLAPFGPDAQRSATATSFLEPGSTDLGNIVIGRVAVPDSADSIVVLVYGDNRPGLRMLTTPWGLRPMIKVNAHPLSWLRALVNLPIAIVQGFVPRGDGFQDAYAMFWSHRYTGGNERPVLEALEHQRTAQLIVNTGDIVQEGRRGALWGDFVTRHERLRSRAPYVVAPGNHERLFDAISRANWDAVFGPPARPMRYWSAIDLPDTLARFVLLDSNLLTDPHDHYPDSLQAVLANEQLAWADSALAAPARWKFVALHHPLVTSGHYKADWKYDETRPPGQGYRQRLLEICRRRGVTAVFVGHEHLYQRTFVHGPDGRGFWHVITGGGGAPIYYLSAADREAARRMTLPDGSQVIANEERSEYHYTRLVLPRHPRGDDPPVLHAIRVRSDGSEVPLDHFNLNEHP